MVREASGWEKDAKGRQVALYITHGRETAALSGGAGCMAFCVGESVGAVILAAPVARPAEKICCVPSKRSRPRTDKYRTNHA